MDVFYKGSLPTDQDSMITMMTAPMTTWLGARVGLLGEGGGGGGRTGTRRLSVDCPGAGWCTLRPGAKSALSVSLPLCSPLSAESLGARGKTFSWDL